MGILRLLTTPFRKYINNHFEMLKQEVRQMNHAEQREAQAMNAVLQGVSGDFSSIRRELSLLQSEHELFVGRQLVETRGVLDGLVQRHHEVHHEQEMLREMMSAIQSSVVVAGEQVRDIAVGQQRMREMYEESGIGQVPTSWNAVSGRDRALLNRMNAHDGYLSQRGVWVNSALSAGFEGTDLGLHDVNERIGEIPFVLGALAALPRGKKILDVGCCESTLSLNLAVSGFLVTALDPRPYPFAHRNLEVVTLPIEAFSPDEPYDAVVLLSTIEHLGIGSYGLDEGERLDLRAMRHLRELLAPDGLLVLTTPFGAPQVNELERTYDVAGVHELLAGFDLVAEPTVLVRMSRTEWIVDSAGFVDPDDANQRVVMLSARRSST